MTRPLEGESVVDFVDRSRHEQGLPPKITGRLLDALADATNALDATGLSASEATAAADDLADALGEQDTP